MEQVTGIQKTVAAAATSIAALGLLLGVIDAETGDKIIAAVPLVFAPILVYLTRNTPA